MSENARVPCPRCKKRGPWLDGPWKPFCSQRCRLIDLGSWLEGNYRISEPLRPEHFSGFEDLPDHVDPDTPER